MPDCVNQFTMMSSCLDKAADPSWLVDAEEGYLRQLPSVGLGPGGLDFQGIHQVWLALAAGLAQSHCGAGCGGQAVVAEQGIQIGDGDRDTAGRTEPRSQPQR